MNLLFAARNCCITDTALLSCYHVRSVHSSLIKKKALHHFYTQNGTNCRPYPCLPNNNCSHSRPLKVNRTSHQLGDQYVSLQGQEHMLRAFQLLDPHATGSIREEILKSVLSQLATGPLCSQVGMPTFH